MKMLGLKSENQTECLLSPGFGSGRGRGQYLGHSKNKFYARHEAFPTDVERRFLRLPA